MTLETAQSLMSTIADSLQRAIDAQNKLSALEKALGKYEPNLYQTYLKNLKEIRENPPVSIALEGFATLQARLVQE
jgi:hypothetical protein